MAVAQAQPNAPDTDPGRARSASDRAPEALNADGGAIPAWQAAIAQRMRDAGESAAAQQDYHLLAGEDALNRHDLVTAANQYAAALKIAPSAELAKRTTQIAAAAEQSALAYSAVHVWAADAPHDDDALRAAVDLALVNDDPNGLARYIPQLVAEAHTPRDGYQQVAGILSGRPAHADTAIKALQQVAAQSGTPPAANYALALVAYDYNQPDIAEQAITQVRKQAPDWDKAGILAAAIAVRQGKADQAAQIVSGLKGSPESRADLHVALARFLLQAGQNDKAVAAFHAALKADPKDSDAHYGLGLVLLSQDQTAAAAKQFKAVINDPDYADDAAFYLGRIAEQNGQLAAARQWYGQVTSGQNALEAGVRAAYLTARMGEPDKALAQLDDLAAKQSGGDTEIVAAKGDILVQAGRLKQALALYDRTLADDPDAAGIRYGRSLVYEKMGRIKAAEADLRRLITEDSDNAEALNALGYMLTTHSTDYARAEKLIRRALAQSPDQPEIVDSLGWVQYKQGQLAKARKNLEKAYADSGDPEIAAHLGRVRWAMGDHAAARAVWSAAAKAHPDDKTLKKLMEEHRQ